MWRAWRGGDVTFPLGSVSLAPRGIFPPYIQRNHEKGEGQHMVTQNRRSEGREEIKRVRENLEFAQYIIENRHRKAVSDKAALKGSRPPEKKPSDPKSKK